MNDSFKASYSPVPPTLVNTTCNGSVYGPSLAGQCRWTTFNTIQTLFLLLTLAMNAFAMGIIFSVPITTSRGTKNSLYFCIRCLNVMDVLQSILLAVSPALATVDCEWVGGMGCCKAMGFLALFFVMVSPLITVIMAVDRVVAIYWPFKYRNYLGLKVLKILLVVFVSLIFLLIAPPLAGVGEYHVVRGRRLCLLDTITDDPVDQAYILIVHGVFLFFLFFMIACSVAFVYKIFFLYQQKSNSLSKKRTNSAIVTTLAVCVTFFCCYAPFVVRVLYEASTMRKSSVLVTWLTFVLALLQPFVNPIVCLFFNVRYYHELKVWWKRVQCDDVTGLDRATLSRSGVRSRSGGKDSEERSILRGEWAKNKKGGNKLQRISFIPAPSGFSEKSELASPLQHRGEPKTINLQALQSKWAKRGKLNT